MSAESHKKYLERCALREAQKAIDRRGAEGFDKAAFASLRIQTLEVWKRLIVGFVGLGFGGAAWYAFENGYSGLGLFLGICGFLLLFVAIFGLTRTIDAVFNSPAIDALFDLLWND